MAVASASGELRLLRVAVSVSVRAGRGDAIHARCEIAQRRVVPRTPPSAGKNRIDVVHTGWCRPANQRVLERNEQYLRAIRGTKAPLNDAAEGGALLATQPEEADTATAESSATAVEISAAVEEADIAAVEPSATADEVNAIAEEADTAAAESSATAEEVIAVAEEVNFIAEEAEATAGEVHTLVEETDVAVGGVSAGTEDANTVTEEADI
eukprot:6186619-Pleurochrysis_carterae.AAC.1